MGKSPSPAIKFYTRSLHEMFDPETNSISTHKYSYIFWFQNCSQYYRQKLWFASLTTKSNAREREDHWPGDPVKNGKETEER